MSRATLYSLLIKGVLTVVFRVLERLVRKDDNIVLLGSGFDRFTDNSKYLFLYLSENCPRTKPYYVVAAPGEYLDLKEQKLAVVLKGSLDNFRLALKCGHVFVTHNVEDIFPVLRRDAVVVNLWHGTPLKKIGYDSIVEQRWIRRKRLALRKIPYDIWSYVVVAHESLCRRFMGSFGKKREALLPFGLPRNDLLFQVKEDRSLQQKYKLKVTASYGLAPDSELILYLPTFRPYRQDNSAFLALFQAFAKSRAGSKKVLLVRLHPHDLKSLDPRAFGPNVICAGSYCDTQELLAASDLMITDYSSVAFDYAILERPIFLFPYDYAQYQEAAEFYEEFYTLFDGYFISGEAGALVQELDNCDAYKNSGFHKKYNEPDACSKLATFFRLD